MRVNPSLTARLRIGFGVLFALLLAVSLIGVGRLFQIRVNYEDEITRYFQLELESERLRAAFILEQASARPAIPQQKPSRAELDRAATSFADAVPRARGVGGADDAVNVRLDQLASAESAWRRSVGEPLVRGNLPPAAVRARPRSACDPA